MHALLFPGQGSQHPGMTESILVNFPYTRLLFEEAEEVFKTPLMCLTSQEDLQTYAQPMLFVMGMAIMHVLAEEYGKTVNSFHLVAGHSLGEYTALCAAGVFSFAIGLSLIKERCRLMQQAPAGGMIAVITADTAILQELLTYHDEKTYGVCVIANDNTPYQKVLSGTHHALDNIKTYAEKMRIKTVKLAVGGPFHSPLMVSLQEEFQVMVNNINFLSPLVPIISNRTGMLSQDAAVIKNNLKHHMAQGVLWTQTQQTMFQEKIRVCFEAGPGSVLAGLGKKTIPEVNFFSLADKDKIHHAITHYNEEIK